MNFRAGQRLRRNDDFRAVREQGRRIDCGAFLLTWRIRPAQLPGTAPRVGVVASRASVGNAIHRNRAKRRLREIYRRHQTLVPSGLDLVLTARAALLRLEFTEVEQRFVQACRKLVPATITPPPHV
jgi:ribonuclease P protein component